MTKYEAVALAAAHKLYFSPRTFTSNDDDDVLPVPLDTTCGRNRSC